MMVQGRHARLAPVAGRHVRFVGAWERYQTMLDNPSTTTGALTMAYRAAMEEATR